MTRKNVSSGVPWERMAGFSRAVRLGNVVEVSLTTAAAADGTILYPDDVYRQTKEAIRIAGVALNEAGASFEDVIKTKMYLKDMSRWQEAGRAHAETFADIRPATGWVGMSEFFAPDIAAEIEMTAHVSADAAADSEGC